jgi:lysozyme family protein
MDPNFNVALNHCMLYEVGPWFNANDPDTIAGNIGTPQLNRKCGYVDIDGDSGGCTKYGVAQKDNPSVDVKSINLAQAGQIYHDSYWVPGKCDQITIPITIFQFDMIVNNGPGRAAKILQQAVGATIDGNIGPATLAAVNAQDPATLINTLSTIRANRYQLIVKNDPSQAKFLDGWLRRNAEVTQFSLAQVSS